MSITKEREITWGQGQGINQLSIGNVIIDYQNTIVLCTALLVWNNKHILMTFIYNMQGLKSNTPIKWNEFLV